VADLYDDLESQAPNDRSRLERALLLALMVVITYTLLAYLVLPALWTHYEHQKRLAALPMLTRTAQGIPGDPINVGLIGDDKDVLCAMQAAGWYPADPVTLRSSIEIAGSVLLDRPYRDAPVSPLFYLDRREDLAFEKPDGNSADHRHHVRFWKVLEQGEEKRPVWLGAVTFDRSVGVSRYTGAIPTISAPISTPSENFSPPIWMPRAWWMRNIRSRASDPRWQGATAAAIPITPTARCGFCGWSRRAASEPGQPPSFPVRPRPKSRIRSGRRWRMP
jgi:hypothetical protein